MSSASKCAVSTAHLYKKTQHLVDLLKKNDIDIVKQLKDLMGQVSPEKQADILLSLMSYIYPKRKAIEHSPIETNETKNLKITFVKPPKHIE